MGSDAATSDPDLSQAERRKPRADMSLPADMAKATFRDWNTYPAVVELDTAADIYALGDIHADYDRLVSLLTMQHILTKAPAQPQAAEWAAGSAVLVVTGDVIDKWTQALPALALLQALRDKAAAAGGRVIVTVGNHEAEFLADPMGSKTADFVSELTAAGISPTDVATGRHPLGQYLRSLPIAARVRDWFFCHAGNTAGRTLAQLDSDIRNGMDQLGFAAPVLLDDNSLLEARLDPTPFWESAGDPATNLNTDAKALGVAHIVMGHQPGKYKFSDGLTRNTGTVFPRFGVLFLTDVGMSRGVDYSKGALMRITKSGTQTTATAVYADGSSTQLFKG